jgi:ribosomal protein S18 acetylase RimI-like enzyme
LIRAATQEDIPAVLDLWQAARSEAARTPDTAEGVRAALDSLLVAEEDGRIVGTLLAAWDGWRGNMYRLTVAPDRRREGIGIALVRAGEELLSSHGARRITALVGDGEPPAESLWRAAGYDHDEQVARYVRNV